MRQIFNVVGTIWDAVASLADKILSYWELYLGWLPFSRLILYAIIFIVIGLPIFFWLRSLLGGKKKFKQPGKLKTGRDIRKEAKWCEKNREFIRAGELYEAIEEFQKAVKMYALGKAPDRAARVYHEKLNDFQSALNVLAEYSAWELAGNLCAKAKRFSEAASFYEKARKIQSAAEMYQEAREYDKAAPLFEKNGFLDQAAACYGQAGNSQKAAEVYETAWKQVKNQFVRDSSPAARKKIEDLAKRASYFYKQSGNLKKSAEVLEQAGITKFAAELYLAMGDKQKAADLFQQMGSTMKAAELYEQAGETHKSAEILAAYYLKQNNLEQAASYYEQAGDHFTAADLYLRLNQEKRAAELYLHGGDSKTAAEVFYKAGEFKLAAQAYENAGNFEMAIEIYRHINDQQKLSELYEKSGNFFEAGQSFYKNGNPEKALVALAQLSEKSPDFPAALDLSGDIYLQLGKNDLALNCYRKLAQKKPFNAENLELYFKIGQVYERAGQITYALNLYQRIYQIAPHYPDLTLRIQSISQKMSSGLGMATDATIAGAGAMGTSAGFRYQVVKELGRGGMGVVYLAKDVNLGRRVAYKVLPQEMKKYPDIVANFIREAKNLAQLNHPYIVSIYDAGENMGNFYIVMEYVEGENLKSLIGRTSRTPIRIGMEIFKQLAQALDYAHSKKVVHRDIKPSNIMWTENQTIKVMDFGLAALLEEVKTGRTLVSGTPLYMSPEQSLGKPLDHRTDIYSTGATMYELLCGTPPFTEGDITYHQIHTSPRPPKDRSGEISDELNRIILKCLSKDPGQRYQNAREIYLDLKAMEG